MTKRTVDTLKFTEKRCLALKR